MTMTHGPRAFAALATAAVLALSACGGDVGSDGSGASSAASETSSDGSSSSDAPAEETPSTTSTEGSAAEGDKATAVNSSVSFNVPKGWKVINPAEITAGSEVPDAVKDMAKAQGTTPEKLVEDIKGLDLLAIGESNGQFADNVNVIAAPMMPTRDELKAELDGIGAKVADTAKVTTSLGAGLDTTYTLSTGGLNINGRMIAIPTDSGSAVITVSTSDAGTADKVTQTILDSLDKA